MMTRRLGLTGSIGAGKSTVARLLRARGFTVLDADEIAREVSRSHEVLAEVASAFGPQYVHEGDLNRPLLSSLVFSQPEQRAALNAIVHPRVRAEMERREREAGTSWVVQDVPLLFEGGLDARMDAIIVVDAPLEARVARVMARDGLSREAVLARDAAQMPAEEKRRRASCVLVNDGDLASLERQLDAALTAMGASS
ncbi:dephospho-CoA kinase [Deinococcus yavapaiensis]|nr:dephospho-CoA kinase [Deinococcus yavapaiensis]